MTEDVRKFMQYLKNEAVGETTLYCPFRLYQSLKSLSEVPSTEVSKNSHKCVFVYNKLTHLTEIEIIPNSYSYKIIRNIQNSTSKRAQSIDRLEQEMDLFTMCIQSMFYLGTIRTNREIGYLLRGVRRLAQTLDIKRSKKKEYIYECFSQIVRILENVTF
jgi:hypothetical protein